MIATAFLKDGGKLVQVPKSGDLTNCANYRALTLLPAKRKLFCNLLLQKVSPHGKDNDHQYGFPHRQGTADSLLLCMPQYALASRGQLTYLFFLDWIKAYGRVMHHAVVTCLAHKGVTGKLGRLIDALDQRCSASTATSSCPWLCIVG
jgi:hypothetical protein